jgi:hypothetical protein
LRSIESMSDAYAVMFSPEALHTASSWIAAATSDDMTLMLDQIRRWWVDLNALQEEEAVWNFIGVLSSLVGIATVCCFHLGGEQPLDVLAEIERAFLALGATEG